MRTSTLLISVPLLLDGASLSAQATFDKEAGIQVLEKLVVAETSMTCPSGPGAEPCWVDLTMEGGVKVVCQGELLNFDQCTRFAVSDRVCVTGQPGVHLAEPVVFAISVEDC